MNTCENCVFCRENSARIEANPYTQKPEILSDCWWRHTWHDAKEPCEKHCTEV